MRKLSIVIAAGVVLASAVLASRDAEACGGCFGPPPPPGEVESVVTDHRMILSVSPQQTTLYDEIRYQGSPSSFAWVLPINGEAKVGISSDTLFTTLDRMTTTSVVAPPTSCPGRPTQCPYDNFDSPQAGGTSGADAGAVDVTHHETVGPYETVQLHSTDPNALNDWLVSHGYRIPDEVKPIVAAYVNAHFDFLALKLVPGQGVQAMRPVRVTTAGASPVLPLRMVAAGTGATVGVTLWVVADGRWEPQNFPSFYVSSDALVWDWASSSSNYKQLRADNEAKNPGRAWEIESSTAQSQAQVRNYVLQLGRVPTGPNGDPDYLPLKDPDSGVVTETSDQVRNDDLDALFKGIGISDGQARVTRMRADLAHASLADDLVLQASADQSVASNVRQVKHEQGEPLCPVYDVDCRQVGTVPRSQAQGAGGGGCAVAPSPNALTELGVAACAVALLFGTRRRRR